MRINLREGLKNHAAVKRAVTTIPHVRAVTLQLEPSTGWRSCVRIAAEHRVNTERLVRERVRLLGSSVPVLIEAE